MLNNYAAAAAALDDVHISDSAAMFDVSMTKAHATSIASLECASNEHSADDTSCTYTTSIYVHA